MADPVKLDYTITSPQQRTALVQKIIDSTPAQKLTNKYLQILSDYIIFAMTKEQKKSKMINTDNRMVTVNKRETSFQGLIAKFENGQDGVYSLFTHDKNILFTPKISITEEDLAEIPPLRELRQEIYRLQEELPHVQGKRKFQLKKQLIQMRKDQYVIKNTYKQPKYCLSAVKSFSSLSFDDNISVTEEGIIQDYSLLSLFNPKHISSLLCNYSKLKDASYGRFYTDGFYLMWDLDTLVRETLEKDYPLYYKIVLYKIEDYQNVEIQALLEQEFHIKHSIEYISSLWRNKIPKLIADAAQTRYLNWYYTEKVPGKWKRCSRCGEIKLAHNKFFSRNNSSRDGFYSICKCCRNKKSQVAIEQRKKRIIKRIPYKPPIEGMDKKS